MSKMNNENVMAWESNCGQDPFGGDEGYVPGEPADAYIRADLDTGWVGGFDTDGSPVLESKPKLTHYSTTNSEWLLLILFAAKRTGIERIEFGRGWFVQEVVTATELTERLKKMLHRAG